MCTWAGCGGAGQGRGLRAEQADTMVWCWLWTVGQWRLCFMVQACKTLDFGPAAGSLGLALPFQTLQGIGCGCKLKLWPYTFLVDYPQFMNNQWLAAPYL